jgi:hypothetical protein
VYNSLALSVLTLLCKHHQIYLQTFLKFFQTELLYTLKTRSALTHFPRGSQGTTMLLSDLRKFSSLVHYTNASTQHLSLGDTGLIQCYHLVKYSLSIQVVAWIWISFLFKTFTILLFICIARFAYPFIY